MDIGVFAFLFPFMVIGLIVFIFSLLLIRKAYGRFVTGTVKPGEISQTLDDMWVALDLFTSLGMSFVWALILGVPALIIGGGILIAIIDSVFGTDLLKLLSLSQ